MAYTARRAAAGSFGSAPASYPKHPALRRFVHVESIASHHRHYVARRVRAPAAIAQADQQKLVADSEKSLSNFLRDPEMGWLQQNFHRAKAVIIAPEIAKAGFIFGGSGGRALVVARDPKSGKWLGPSFYVMATASIGFQAGISVSENVTLVMTDKGFNSLLATSFKMGGDASVAAGPVGAGAKSDIVADLTIQLWAMGRMQASMRGFAMRLKHMGFDAYVVFDTTTPVMARATCSSSTAASRPWR